MSVSDNQSVNQSKIPYFWNDSHVDTPDMRVAVYQCKSAPLTFDEALSTLETLASQYGIKANKQSTNQSITDSRSINQSTNQSLTDSINQSVNQSISQSINQSVTVSGPVDLIVFPELWLTGYDVHAKTIRSRSISLQSDQMNRIRQICAKYEIALSFGYAEREEMRDNNQSINQSIKHSNNQSNNQPINHQSTNQSINQSASGCDEYDGPLFNSSVTIDVDGRIANNYRKAHLWQDGEQSCFLPGNELSSFTLKNHSRHRFGVQICYDIEFCEPSRELALQGVSVLIVHTALSKNDKEQIVPLRVVPTRAIDNHMFLLYSNFVSMRDKNQSINDSKNDKNQSINDLEMFEMCGLSSIIGPDGRDLIRASNDRCQFIIANLIPSLYVTNFHRTPFLPSRRVELMKLTRQKRQYDYTPVKRTDIQKMKSLEHLKIPDTIIINLEQESINQIIN